jgi:signal transduction histidine kinase
MANIQGLVMEKTWKTRGTSFEGIVGAIQRQRVLELFLMLGVILVTGMAAHFLFVIQSTPVTVEIVILSFLSLAVVLGGLHLFVSHKLIESLQSIRMIENSITKVVDSDLFLEDLDQSSAGKPGKSLAQACEAFVKVVKDYETVQLGFLAKVGHELRSPLATILGYADLLSDPELRCDDEFLDTCHRVIVEQGRNINQFIEDVLVAAAVKVERYQDNMTRTALSKLISEILIEMQSQKNWHVTFENSAGDVYVVGDALRLRDLILNLVENAVKYSHHEKPVQIHLRPAGPPGKVELAVIDQGIGIDPSRQSELFLPFSRIKSEQTRSIPGSGLGLYIVKNIVKQHHGEIRVQSQPGVGSTFVVNLPVSP